MKKITKVIKLLLIIIVTIIFVFLPMHMKYVIGIVGNTDGAFVVGFSLLNSENRHNLLFYNCNCQLINKVTLYKRGGITIGSYNDYVIIQDGLGKTELYDYNGNYISPITYTERLIPQFSYSDNNFSLKYKQNFFGDEFVIYYLDNKLVDVDIGYDFYRMVKLKKVILQFFIAFFIVIIYNLIFKMLNVRKTLKK